LTRIYHNNGDGTFSNSNVVLPGVRAAAVAAGDFDNDGNLDFVITGTTNVTSNLAQGAITQIYHNNGDGTFSNIQAALPGIYQGGVAWGDFDNDGKLDLAMTGLSTNGAVTRIFQNSNGSFTNVLSQGMPDLLRGNILPGDFDNVGRPDILLTGVTGIGTNGITKIFRNVSILTNTPPNATDGLATIVSATGKSVTFSWNAASDAQTPASGLKYNLRVGISPGGQEIISAEADLATGWRRLPAPGNVPHGRSFTLTNLTPGATYYWSVQAIDTTFAGSPFASEKSFIAVPPPQLEIAPQTGGELVQGAGLAGLTYRIEATTNLAPSSQWITVTNLNADGTGHFQFVDQPSNAEQRFYRAAYP
jgi:hypothetical protein